MKSILLIVLITLSLCLFSVFAHNVTCPPSLTRAVKQDLLILNYALTLEHLEYAFYRDGLIVFNDKTLIAVIESLGGTPVSECKYEFGYGSDFQKFLAIARALENTGVSAYLGQVENIINKTLLTAAGTIVTVEARHASWLNYKTGNNPFPDAFDTPLNSTEVLAIASGFFVSCPSNNTECFGVSNTSTSVCSGKGTCEGPDLCFCDPGWTGPNCECESSCPLCASPNECCEDISRGPSCFNPSTHHCVRNDQDENVLCGSSDNACGDVCFDPLFSTCDGGSLVPASPQNGGQGQAKVDASDGSIVKVSLSMALTVVTLLFALF